MAVQLRHPMRNYVTKLTVNMEAFCRYKAAGLGNMEAARRVGYGQPATAAYRLMCQPHVRAAIAKIKAEADPTTAEHW